MNKQTKAVVSVAEMARMVGLSRQRFYQLMGSTFPTPMYDVKTRRPFYPEDLQLVCLEVRRSSCGADGKPILFYAKGHRPAPKRTRSNVKESRQKSCRIDWIVDGLAALGMQSVSNDQVATAISQVCPDGIDGLDQQEVLRDVFLQIKRQDCGDNVGQ